MFIFRAEGSSAKGPRGGRGPIGTSRVGLAGRAGLVGRARGLGLTGGLARGSPAKRKGLVERGGCQKNEEAEVHLPSPINSKCSLPSRHKSNVTSSMKSSLIFHTHHKSILLSPIPKCFISLPYKLQLFKGPAGTLFLLILHFAPRMTSYQTNE